jgi:hypothetical protein
MNRNQFAIAAVALATTLAGVSTLARAEDTTRQDRMDSAYSDYKSNPRYNHSDSTSMSTSNSDSTKGGGRFDRAESSVKRGAHKTGDAIKSGAHKTAEALRRTGDKIKDKVTPSN